MSLLRTKPRIDNPAPAGTIAMRVRITRTIVEDHYVLVSAAAQDPIATAAAVVATDGAWSARQVSHQRTGPQEIEVITPQSFVVAVYGQVGDIEATVAYLSAIEAPETPPVARVIRQ